jgi:hypothetical protein
MRGLGNDRQLGSHFDEANALTFLGRVWCSAGDFRRAADAQTRALEIFRRIGDRIDEAWALTHYAATIAATGDRPRALTLYQQALAMARMLNRPSDEALCLEGIADHHLTHRGTPPVTAGGTPHHVPVTGTPPVRARPPPAPPLLEEPASATAPRQTWPRTRVDDTVTTSGVRSTAEPGRPPAITHPRTVCPNRSQWHHLCGLVDDITAGKSPATPRSLLVCHAPGVLRHTVNENGTPLVRGKQVTRVRQLRGGGGPVHRGRPVPGRGRAQEPGKPLLEGRRLGSLRRAGRSADHRAEPGLLGPDRRRPHQAGQHRQHVSAFAVIAPCA